MVVVHIFWFPLGIQQTVQRNPQNHIINRMNNQIHITCYAHLCFIILFFFNLMRFGQTDDCRSVSEFINTMKCE